MKSIRVILVVLLIIAILSAAYIVIWFATHPLSGSESASLFIHPGDTGTQVAKCADSLGLVSSVRSLRILSILTGLDKKLRVGRYDFTPDHSRLDIYRMLRDGKAVSIKVTIPEGLTLKRILSILADSTHSSHDEFRRLAADTAFIETLGFHTESLEGYLFPETYLIPWGAPPPYTVKAVTDNLNNFLVDSLKNRMREIHFSLHETLTLASLIESEARDGEERELISSVYHNRLRQGMLLQCDPTVIYALGGLDRALLLTDLEIDSPYNTYKYSGLPPGPICSPGSASLLAALYPAETRFLFFVADGSGKHIFSETLQQHNTARSRVKANR
ncbi:MAG: endolytic transglycosylase MltG [candidate division Zixibacteria bacterium]|nr:endolytic transglycosylase MltG [candidate division Zixibacteria bacterium]MBU1472059.1 endolytic transglycosylase MltG [candidate division Zixibacteria bacterium]